MAKVAIKTLKQTEKNGLFSLVFENEAYSSLRNLSKLSRTKLMYQETSMSSCLTLNK